MWRVNASILEFESGVRVVGRASSGRDKRRQSTEADWRDILGLPNRGRYGPGAMIFTYGDSLCMVRWLTSNEWQVYVDGGYCCGYE